MGAIQQLILSNNPTGGYLPLTEAYRLKTGISNTAKLTAWNNFEAFINDNSLIADITNCWMFMSGSFTAAKFDFMDVADVTGGVFGGSLTSSDNGILPDATNGYFDTGIDVSTFNKDSIGTTYYSRTNRTLDYGCPFGAYNPSNYQYVFFSRFSGDSVVARISTTVYNGDSYTGVTNSNGCWTVQRYAGTEVTYRNGVSLGNGSTSSTSLPSGNLFAFCVHQIGGAGQYFDNQEQSIFIQHVGLSPTKVALLHTGVINLMVELGINV